MNKIRNFVSKYDNLIIFLIIIIVVVPNTISKDLQPYDNLWNFGNIYKISEGQLIYRDINIIQTPIFFDIGALLFKITSANYLIFIIYGIIIMTILYFLVYRIARTLKINKIFSILITLIIMFMTTNVMCYGANYNMLAFVFFEVGVLTLLNGKHRKCILQSFLTVLIFLTYQKLGAGYFLLYLLYEMVSNKEIKNGFINIGKVVLFSGIIMIPFLSVMLIRGNLYDFINMCFLSISEFTNNTIGDNKYIIINLLSAILVFCFSLFVLKNKKVEIDRNNVLILLFAAIGTNLNIIPIVNEYHVKIALILWIILFVYEIYYCLFEILKDHRIIKALKILECLIILEIVVYSGIQMYNYVITNKTKYDKLFFGAIISGNLENNMNNVNKYIHERREEGSDIKILSSYAMLYTLENKIDNGFFDEPLIGNLGKKGTTELIEKIQNLSDNTFLLVENEERTPYKIYQFTSSVRDYVVEHYKSIDIVENYDVYRITN